MQCTSTVLMVRPASFGFNEQTAVNNHFQDKNSVGLPFIQRSALKEFDMMAELLKYNGIEVIVINDTEDPPKPDAIFPNNWFSCSKDAITLFPMYAENRRTEKREYIIEKVKAITGKDMYDMGHHENQSRFLEGTGSMVCDHRHKIIYACLSERTNEDLLNEYASLTGYSTCTFLAADKNGKSIYHTNVMMCIGDQFAILCADALKDEAERIRVIDSLHSTGHEIIFISQEQVSCFAGNMLQLNSKAGVPFLLMSTTAAGSLLPGQLIELKKYATPLIADVSTIEKAGGGSVRCMVAEIF